MRYFKFRTCNNDNFEALENYKIYASLLSDFNDPFEGDAWEDLVRNFFYLLRIIGKLVAKDN